MTTPSISTNTTPTKLQQQQQQSTIISRTNSTNNDTIASKEIKTNRRPMKKQSSSTSSSGSSGDNNDAAATQQQQQQQQQTQSSNQECEMSLTDTVPSYQSHQHTPQHIMDPTNFLTTTTNGGIAAGGTPSTPSGNNNSIYQLPKLIPVHSSTTDNNEFDKVSTFVAKAVYEQHYESNDIDDSKPSIGTYRAIMDAFRLQSSDTNLLYKILIALTISGNGKTLDLLNTSITYTTFHNQQGMKHARLLHYIVRYNPFGTAELMEQQPSSTTTNDDPMNDTGSTKIYDYDDMTYNVTNAYLHFVIALVTKNIVFLQPVLQQLWYLVTDKSFFIVDEDDDQEILKWKPKLPTRRVQYIHSAIATIIRVCPEANQYLHPIIVAGLAVPNRYWDRRAMISYYHQCFTVLQYLPSIRYSVYKLIIENCIEMDVEIIIQDSGAVILDEDTTNNNKNTNPSTPTNATTTTTTTVDTNNNIVNDNQTAILPNQQQQVQDDDTAVSVITEAANTTATPTSKATPNLSQTEIVNNDKVIELANKLDKCMLLLFRETEKYIFQYQQQQPSDLLQPSQQQLHILQQQQNNIVELYEIISPIFESVVLVTHKSKFVQFLILHLCGLQIQVLKKHNQLLQQVEEGHEQQQPVTPSSATSNDNTKLYEQITLNTDPITDEVILYREFAAKLIETVLDPVRGTVIRQTAACYLASFISRARYVSTATACEALEALVRWAEAYIESVDVNRQDEYHPMHAVTDSREQCNMYALFYTVCQSALYIMCFCGNDIHQYYEQIKSSTEYEDMQYVIVGSDRWTKICCHWLQPLRYCLESVRSEFLHISKIYNLLSEDVHTKLLEDEQRRIAGLQKLTEMRMRLKRRSTWYTRRLRRNYDRKVLRSASASSVASVSTIGSRINTSAMSTSNASISTAGLEYERVEGGVGGLGHGTNPLDSFFPFDPYLLQLSHDHVDPYYRHWDGCNVDNQDDDDDDDYGDDDMVGTEVAAANDDSVNNNDDDDDDLSDGNEDDGDEPDEDDEDSTTADGHDIPMDNNDDEEVDDDNNSHSSSGKIPPSGVMHQNRDDNDDSEDESDDDDDETSIADSSTAHAMSYTSNESGILHHRHNLATMKPSKSVIGFENEIQHRTWLTAMKRPRAPSIETGSW